MSDTTPKVATPVATSDAGVQYMPPAKMVRATEDLFFGVNQTRCHVKGDLVPKANVELNGWEKLVQAEDAPWPPEK